MTKAKEAFTPEVLEYIDQQLKRAVTDIYQEKAAENAENMLKSYRVAISQSLEFQDLYKIAVTTQRTAIRTEQLVDKMQLELDTTIERLNITRFLSLVQGIAMLLLAIFMALIAYFN